MIREKTTDAEVLATTLGRDRIRMTLDEDEDGIVQLCDTLSGQYSDEELAALREYCTNARDSHIEAGNTDPIEVLLPCGPYDMPTEENPRSLRIRDKGTGLSVEEVAEVLSRYGKSTKNKSNDQQGLFGIGSKVGLVPTFGSFKFTAVKDGQKCIVLFGRDEAGVPVMDLAYTGATGEPNGVEVELPVHSKYNGLARKSARFFQFWPEGSVLVDGKVPDRIKPKVRVSDNMWIVEDISIKGHDSIIVMGDVPYPANLDTKLKDGHTLVVFVPIGAVMPTPSRESLRMTPDTKTEIARLTAEYDQLIQSTIQRNVDQAKTKAEAMKTALKWRSVFASTSDLSVTWKRIALPTFFEVKTKVQTADGSLRPIVIANSKSRKLNEHDRKDKIFVGTLVDSVLVHGYAMKFNSNHKKKLVKWAEINGFAPEHFVLTEKKLAHGWVDSTFRVDWNTVKKIKFGSKLGGLNRIRGSFDVWFSDGTWKEGLPADQIDTTKPVFYIAKGYFDEKPESGRNRWENRNRNRSMRIKRKAAFERYPNATFVGVPDNRRDKFIRDFPQARSLNDLMTEIYVEFKKTVKRSDLMRVKIERCDNRHLLQRMDPAKVKDPKFATAIRQAKRKLNEQLRFDIDRMKGLVGSLVVDSDKALTVKWVDPFDQYPLASGTNIEHTYLYINAVYAAGAQVKS